MATEIAERYRLLEPLGRGGMGTVWRARDEKLGRLVALKEVRFPAYLPEDERRSLRERVLQEARAAASLNHQGAVTVFDVFEDDDKTYIAMELVEWPTLADLVQQRGPLPERVVAEIGVGLLEALSEAHGKGIIHRDVKPANVMVSPEGRVKLTDFGVASVSGGPDLTATGAIVGSPSYMSPERAEGAEASHASDLWALGATLYFAVAGRAPFEREEVLPTLHAIISEEAPPLEGALGTVIMTLLSKEPDARPDAGRLAPMLEAAARTEAAGAPSDTMRIEAVYAEDSSLPTEHGAGSTKIEDHEAGPAVFSPRAESLPASDRMDSRRRRWLLPLVALIVVAFAAVALSRLPEPGSPQNSQTAQDQPGRQSAPVSEDSQQEEETAGQPGETGAPAQKQETGTAVPRDWRTFVIAGTGHQISYPPAWRLVRDPIGDGSSARFQGPSGKYLLLDWTDQPGTDAAAAWESQARSFAGRHQDYREIRIEQTTFRDFNTAAIWEFTYSQGGTQLHAIDLGFADDRWGFALNFQTREDDWQESQRTFEQFKASFRPA